MQTTDRSVVDHLIAMPQFVDVVIPRGGKSLIERISAGAKVPVIKHLDGNCHMYDGMILATWTWLSGWWTTPRHRSTAPATPPRACWWPVVAADFLPRIAAVFAAKSVEMRCDAEAHAIAAKWPLAP